MTRQLDVRTRFSNTVYHLEQEMSLNHMRDIFKPRYEQIQISSGAGYPHEQTASETAEII